MVEQQKQRIELELSQRVDDLDRTILRKMQVRFGRDNKIGRLVYVSSSRGGMLVVARTCSAPISVARRACHISAVLTVGLVQQLARKFLNFRTHVKSCVDVFFEFEIHRLKCTNARPDVATIAVPAWTLSSAAWRVVRGRLCERNST